MPSPGSRPTFPLTDRSNLYDAILPYAAEVAAASTAKHRDPAIESTISDPAQEAASGKRQANETRHRRFNFVFCSYSGLEQLDHTLD